jgi:hypothetical protein
MHAANPSYNRTIFKDVVDQEKDIQGTVTGKPAEIWKRSLA